MSDVSDDFKKFASTKLLKSILEHQAEGSKEWMIKVFQDTGEIIARIQIINSGHFKNYYAGKPTKRFLKITEELKQVEKFNEFITGFIINS